MPKTIIQGFEKLRENLRITDIQEETVTTRERNLKSNLEEELKVIDYFLTGSYERGTLISPLSTADIDVFFVLDSNCYKADGQPLLLDRVRRILKRTYPTTSEISRNGQAVTVQFSDFRVDVVPGFQLNGGSYIIPDSIAGEWITTDPKKHIQMWHTANYLHNYDLTPLAKMIKGWNKTHSQLLRSFHLEMLVFYIMDNVQISSFPLSVAYIFDKARSLIEQTVLDPAGYRR